jgi:tRNA nucleotidyltransferase/poly(A) polymerase
MLMSRLSKFKSSAASRDLRALLSEPPGDRLLSDFVEAGGRPFVMAGAVRDAVAINLTAWPVKSPRDVDIGVAGLRKEPP